MEMFKELNETMDRLSGDIAKELAARNWFDITEATYAVKIRLSLAIKQCISLQVDDLITQKAALVAKQFGRGVSGRQQAEIAAQISTMKVSIRERQQLRKKLQDEEEYKLLREYLRANGHGETLQTFFKTINRQ